MNKEINRYRQPQRKNLKLVILTIVAAVLVLTAVIVVLLDRKPPNASTEASGAASSQIKSAAPAASSQAGSQAAGSSDGGGSSSQAGASSSASSQTSSTTNPEAKAGEPVPESAPVNMSYFKDAVFVGNSRTEGLMLYTDLGQHATAFADKGLTVSTAFSNSFIKQGNKKVTVSEALKTAEYNKCYIMLGINELGWVNETAFISHYGQLVDDVKSTHPNAKIYVQSILPVSDSKSKKNQNGINNDRIKTYNDLLKKLATEKGVYYLDSAASVKGEDGALPESATSDGVHMNRQFCTQWLDYLKNHTVK